MENLKIPALSVNILTTALFLKSRVQVSKATGYLLVGGSILSCDFRKRSGSCRGKYNTAIYTQLDNICEDCYNLYKDPDVHHMCRSVHDKQQIYFFSINHEITVQG